MRKSRTTKKSDAVPTPRYKSATRPSALWSAWGKVQRRKSIAGTDGITLEKFRETELERINQIAIKLHNGEYQVHPFLEASAFISGKERLLSIPSLSDRIVSRAVLDEIGPSIDKLLAWSVFGYRSGRSTREAAWAVARSLIGNCSYVVKYDIRSFFPSIDRLTLFAELERHIGDQSLLSLIKRLVSAPITRRTGQIERSSGLQLGSNLSPILSNYFLRHLDKEHTRRYDCAVRYADDGVILTKSRKAAARAIEGLEFRLAIRNLELAPNKTLVYRPGEHFTFLGYLVGPGELRAPSAAVDNLVSRLGGFVYGDIAAVRSVSAWLGYYRGLLGEEQKARIRSALREIGLGSKSDPGSLFSKEVARLLRWL